MPSRNKFRTDGKQNGSPPRTSRQRNERKFPSRGKVDLLRDDEASVTLKNGAKANLVEAAACFDMLNDLFARGSDHFNAIRSLASGHKPDVSPSIIGELRSIGFLAENGELRPTIRDVFASSYRPTADGDVLTNPFAPASGQEQRLLDANESRYQRRLKKLDRKLDRDGNKGQGI